MRTPKENFFRALARISFLLMDGIFLAMCSLVLSTCAVPVIPLAMTFHIWKEGGELPVWRKSMRCFLLFPIICIGAMVSPLVKLWGDLRTLYPIALHEWRIRDIRSENPYLMEWMRKRIKEDEAVRRRNSDRLQPHPAEGGPENV